MTTFVNVHCPKCGGVIDVPVQIARISLRDGDFKQPQVATIYFKTQKVIDHECRRPT